MRSALFISLLVVCVIASSVYATDIQTDNLDTQAKVVRGKMSTFGGPNDRGVSPSEGLALYTSVSQRPELFLSYQPPGTTGLARRLNPEANYIALRWVYSETSVSWLRSHQVTVQNPRTGATATAWPADWGPHVNTGRVADLSPGLARKLGLNTDDVCVVTVPI